MIKTKQLRKEYIMGDSVVKALDGVDLEIETGEFLAITGTSGSGKSTLMHILGGLDHPTSGTLEFRNRLISAMTEKQIAEVRNREIGFVFQTFNLINRTTALDNVCVPLMYTRRAYRRTTAMEALARVGLKQRAQHKPSEMSGGECQRVAIARAIVNRPSLLLADEPTGNLDTKTSHQILTIFHELHREGITIIIVTHEMAVAVQADRIIQMSDGKIVEDTAVDEQRRKEILAITQDAHERMFEQKKAAGSASRMASLQSTKDRIRDSG